MYTVDGVFLLFESAPQIRSHHSYYRKTSHNCGYATPWHTKSATTIKKKHAFDRRRGAMTNGIHGITARAIESSSKTNKTEENFVQNPERIASIERSVEGTALGFENIIGNIM